MVIGYLNERTRTILNMVLKTSAPLRLKEIAEQLSLSTRTIYNEVDKANGWLRQEKLAQLEVERGRIQLFSEEDRLRLEAVLHEDEARDDYIFTPTERIRMIICYIIIARESVYIEELMDICLVSRNTVFTDLQAVISQLHAYGLDLTYESKTGYRIDGDTVRLRAIFFLYFNMLEPLLAAGRLGFIHMEDIAPYLEPLREIEKAMRVQYIEGDLIALAAMLPVMEEGRADLCFAGMDPDKVRQSREFRLVLQYFPQLSAPEQVYLTLHFLGARLNSYSSDLPDTKPDETTMEITRNLVSEFERRACVEFDKRQDLIHDLYLHIRASMYRYRFGIQIGNPMVDDVVREYPDLFDLTRAAGGYLEQQVGVQLSDSEVAYLALHFGAHLELEKPKDERVRILVVCVNGVATGNMIRQELQRLLPGAEIIGVKAAADVVNPQNYCDLIVSSVRLRAVVPVIVVGAVMNAFDRHNILSHPLIRAQAGFVDVEALFRMLQKYVPENRQAELRRDLTRFFAREDSPGPPALSSVSWQFEDFLTEDRIVFLSADGLARGAVTAPDHPAAGQVPAPEEAWKASLYSVAAPLIERGSIYPNYPKHIIGRLTEAGPYMFVTKDLILAHARPENGVRHLDLAVGIAPEGIPFGHEKTAKIVLMIAPEDQQKHMGILRDIRRLFAKKEQVEALTAASSPAEVCSILMGRLHPDG